MFNRLLAFHLIPPVPSSKSRPLRALDSPADETDCAVGFNKAWRLLAFTRRLHSQEGASQRRRGGGGKKIALMLVLWTSETSETFSIDKIHLASKSQFNFSLFF